MILGIDASNIRAGGGVTHLSEVLRAAEPHRYGFEQVVLWSGRATLDKIEDRPWLRKLHDPLLDGSLVHRVYWQRFRLRAHATQIGCNVLFVPGGSDASRFRPMVTMNQNLLPFEWRELRRYGWSPMTLKFALLRFTQARTFRRADGLIYLSGYAREVVGRFLRDPRPLETTIAHGIHPRFFMTPRPTRRIEECDARRPMRILYVSIVDVYKHQWQVAEAVARLREQGLPVALDLVGPPGAAIQRLRATLSQLDSAGEFLRYRGAIAYEELHQLYDAADIGVFASSCETFGQILTESMAAGLPIASSRRAAMPELLADTGEYFDPESPEEIAAALRRLIDSPALRAKMAAAAHARAQLFSWKKCAHETFEFLARAGRVR
jgi:glycosyltransferase involved in cell wall biosynthesis